MSESTEISEVPEEEPRPVRVPLEFAGAIDERVIRDVHHLFQRTAKRREALMLVLGIAAIGLGTWSAVAAHGNPKMIVATLRSFMSGLVLLSIWWSLQKGWARFMLDQVITGRIHSVGIVVDQLGDRAGWGEFCSARVSDKAALLFVNEKEITPQVVGFDGFPLHRSFFESDEAWQMVSQMIRERVRNVSLVAGA